MVNEQNTSSKLVGLCNSYLSHLDDGFERTLIVSKVIKKFQNAVEKNYDIVFNVLGIDPETGVSNLVEFVLKLSIDHNDTDKPQSIIKSSYYPYIIKEIIAKYPDKKNDIKIYTSKSGSLVLRCSQKSTVRNHQ